MIESKLDLIKRNELKVSKVISDWYYSIGKEQITKYVLDPDGIFSTENGSKAGVYLVYVVVPTGKEILMYVGEVGKAGRGFRDRLAEHLKYWLTNPEWYTGVQMKELEAGYKYKICIWAEEANDAKRYDLEQRTVEETKPYTQFWCYPFYDRKKNNYYGYDLCIFGSYKRRAFVVARDGKYTEEAPELVLYNIYSLAAKEDLSNYKGKESDNKIIEKVKEEMPQGSEIHRTIKAFVEREMGITGRGYKYKNLVHFLAASLAPFYEEKRVM